jgi:hypothetical protein
VNILQLQFLVDSQLNLRMGSAIYVLGDKKNDHRIYTILDGQPAYSYTVHPVVEEH